MTKITMFQSRSLLSLSRRRRRRSLLLLYWLIASSVIQAVVGGAEDEQQDEQQQQQQQQQQQEEASTSSDIDALVISSFSFLCAICISFFAVNLFYFSILEDCLMRRYLKEGVTMKAHVYSTDYIRDTPKVQSFLEHFNNNKKSTTIEEEEEPNTTGNNGSSQEEYVAVIDYVCNTNPDQQYQQPQQDGGLSPPPPPKLHKQQQCVVRKQVKANGGDFTIRAPEVPTCIQMISAGVHHVVQLEIDDGLLGSELMAPTAVHGGGGAEHEYSVNEDSPPLELQVIMLPDHINSGMGLNQVYRISSMSYRIPTVLMFVFLLLVTSFFLVLGILGCIDLLLHDNNNEIEGSTSLSYYAKWTCILLAILLALEASITHCCLQRPIRDALEEEYLKGGDFVLSRSNDSTSISTSDDSYLLLDNNEKSQSYS